MSGLGSWRCSSSFALVSYELSGLVQKAEAIPAFARKYDFKCNVCHVPGFPKLNDFGNLFRDRGYQLGSEADSPVYEGIGMGYLAGVDPNHRRVSGGKGADGRQRHHDRRFRFHRTGPLEFRHAGPESAFGVVFTPGLGSAGFGTGASDGDLEAAFVRLMRLERFLGVKSASRRLSAESHRSANSSSIFRSAKSAVRP